MKQSKNETQTSQVRTQRKISEMIWEFAGDFIRRGATRDDRQSRLTAAGCAWNIASTKLEQRAGLLDRYLLEYRRFNPRITPGDVAAIRGDMETLVGRKLKLFPMDLRQIVGLHLVPAGDGERIEAASATIG